MPCWQTMISLCYESFPAMATFENVHCLHTRDSAQTCRKGHRGLAIAALQGPLGTGGEITDLQKKNVGSSAET